MSRIYTGQDGDLFIFSRERPPTPESEQENEHEEGEHELEDGHFEEQEPQKKV